MRYRVVSTYGRYIRRDFEDWTDDVTKAAQFPHGNAAADWIEENYGQNGFKFFSPEAVRNVEGNPQEVVVPAANG